MTVFSEVQKARPAQRVVEPPLSAWSDDFEGKPEVPVSIGLRLVSEGDIERARAMAIQTAIASVPEPGDDRTDALNGALMTNILARATCMSDDARESYFRMPEDMVAAAFTEDGIKLLWDAYLGMKRDACTFLPEATDDDLTMLAGMLLSEDAWTALPTAIAKRLRRTLFDVLETLDPELHE
jgi:hypothetical protein